MKRLLLTIIVFLIHGCFFPVHVRAQNLPKNWVAAGVGYETKLTEWTSYATEVNVSQSIWSYTTYSTSLKRNSVPTVSLRTGLAWDLKQLQLSKTWQIHILAIGTGGSTQTATAVTSSFAGGGALILLHGHWTFHAGTHAETGAAKGTVKEISIGYAF